MQAQDNHNNITKNLQTVEKYVPLIHQNKVYQFTQKMLLLSHRKQQSKKYQQAEQMLSLAIQKLHSIQSLDKDQGYVLFDNLLKLYQTHPQIWNLEKAKRVYKMLNIRQNQIKYKYYVNFLKTLKNKPFPRELFEDLVKYYVNRNQFTKAESHAIELDNTFINKFCQQWCKKVSIQQSYAIKCRLALLKGLFSNIQNCSQILQGVNQKSPFYKFSNFLISAAKLKSKEAYDLLGSRYGNFLIHDEIYNKIYQSYGVYYFNIKKNSKGGLMDLLK